MKSDTLIIVLNWNGKEDTSLCLNSLKEVGADVVIVDNGSTDGSQEHFRKNFPQFHLIETEKNLGYAGGNNVGIEYGMKKGYKTFLILNNDTTVASDLLDRFAEVFSEHPSAGVLGAKIYLMDEPKRFDHFGGIWKKGKSDFEYVGKSLVDEGLHFETSEKLDYVCGACLMVRKEVFEAIGLFDPRFFLFWEETDFCFRARAAGFEVRTAPKAKVWHKVGASFTGGKPHSTYFFWRNRLLWTEKNFSGMERLYYLWRLLFLGGVALHCQKGVRTLQLGIQKMLCKNSMRNEDRLVRIRSQLMGMNDYLLRRFGMGRSTHFLKKK